MDGWQIEGEQSSFGHDGCGGREYAKHLVLTTDLLRESRSSCHSRYTFPHIRCIIQASAILLLACIAERQLEQDLAAVPFSAGECIRMHANLAQPLRAIKIAQDLHDVGRNVNAGAYSCKAPSLFVNPHRETLALQPSGGCRASKSGSDNCNAGAAPHLRYSPKSRPLSPHRGSTVQPAPTIFDV